MPALQVSSLRQQLQAQREAADAAQQQAEEAAQQKVAALVRVSEAEGGRSRADGRIAQLTEASGGRRARDTVPAFWFPTSLVACLPGLWVAHCLTGPGCCHVCIGPLPSHALPPAHCRSWRP